jgi:hypothetical protein
MGGVHVVSVHGGIRIVRLLGAHHMNIVQMVQVFKALMQGPASRLDLAARTGVPPKTVGKLLTELKRQKMIYVVDYSNEADGRNRVKLYTFGDGEDAQPKSTQPQEERSRKSYLKKVAVMKQAKIKTTFVGGKGLWQ